MNRIDEINRELEAGPLRPERVVELLKEKKKLGHYAIKGGKA